MKNYWNRKRLEIAEHLRRRPVFAGLTFLVLTAVNIPVTIATIRIWKLLFSVWNDTSWNVLREFFVDALVVTLIAFFIWLIVGLITVVWVSDRRSAGDCER